MQPLKAKSHLKMVIYKIKKEKNKYKAATRPFFSMHFLHS